MADFTITNLTTAVTGVVTTTNFAVQSTTTYTQTTTNGTVSVRDLNIGIGTAVSASPNKRPLTGMAFPRGIYNK